MQKWNCPWAGLPAAGLSGSTGWNCPVPPARANPAAATQALLAAHLHLIGLFVSDNEYVIGVGPALEYAHVAGKVLAIGMEASGPELKYVRDGTLTGGSQPRER